MKMNKIKFAKYKLIDTDISKDIAKKIVGRQFTVERVKDKGGPTTKPRAKAPAWFIEFRDEQREFNVRIEKEISNLNNRLDKHDKRFENIVNRLDRQDERFENIENRMDKIDDRLDRQEKRIENIEHELST